MKYTVIFYSRTLNRWFKCKAREWHDAQALAVKLRKAQTPVLIHKTESLEDIGLPEGPPTH